MISKVYVQSEAGVPSDEAFFKAWHGFGKRRIARELFTSDEFAAGTLELSRSTLVAGAIRIVEAAIDTIGMRRPQANNLPDELHKYFGRRVTKTDLGTLRSAWSTGTAAACFVKPLSKNKLFPATRIDVRLCPVRIGVAGVCGRWPGHRHVALPGRLFCVPRCRGDS
jgi:hypothetical protein